MNSDIEIAQATKLLDIRKIAKKSGINKKYLEVYGNNKAKVNLDIFSSLSNEDGKLILVTAMNPTKFGEGKTTTTIGLAQAFKKLNKKVMIALREPSLGPVFGLKGGATGGGMAQVVPMEEINLHFTGDFHAITVVNNLISACIDNHIFQGNLLKFDTEKISWKRCLDLNDRSLREVEVGLGAKNGVARKDGFNITVASEIMAILCLSKNLDDFKAKVEKCIVGISTEGNIITVKDLNIAGSLAALMTEAIKPNLVQSLEHVPTLIHGGPFANIAHGCNSILATKLGLKLSDYLITEAGFGADLGGEKFLNIKCRYGDLKPSVAVIVATIRAIRFNGGAEDPKAVDINAIRNGLDNLAKHIENIQKFKIPYVVTINKFENDSVEEIEYIKNWCLYNKHPFALNDSYAKGGAGGVALARKVLEVIKENPTSGFKPLYELDLPVKDKIKIIAKEIYGARGVRYTDKAEADIKWIENNGYGSYAICMAKTPLSLSDSDKLLGRPTGFYLNIQEVRLSAGAEFIIPLSGSILTMPGLPIEPAATKIDVKNGKIVGLF